jgi:hypothetical protein
VTPFLDNFQSDPEMDGLRRLWRTRKPLLLQSVVAYAPYYPEYPKLKVRKSQGPSSDPSCPSARDASDEIEVVMYSDHNNFGDLQENAWNFILANAAEIEANLRCKLVARHLNYLKQFREEELPGATHLHKYWKLIESKLNVDDVSAIDHFFKLVGIGLADSGLDECGFSSFEFQTGWDRDHGIGILMHKTNVLTAGGMTEFIGSSHDIVAGVKCVQAYEMDEGDLSLLDK